MTAHSDGIDVEKVAAYQSDYSDARVMSKIYPVFHVVVMDLLRCGMPPEEITFEFVERTIEESPFYRSKAIRGVWNASMPRNDRCDP